MKEEKDGNTDSNNNNNDHIEELKKKLVADQEEDTTPDNDHDYMTTLKAELESKITDRDYAEFVIRTIKRTVKQEDLLVRQIFYSGLSKNCPNPINLAVLAPTSEGKTYPVLESLQYFPKRDTWKLGSMTPKVIIRQNGILVDQDNEPLKPKIKELRKRIRSDEIDDEEKEELQEQLEQLYLEAKVLIDLRDKILVFLEPPHVDTWSILKPILSHDDFEIEHPYVYEVQGLGFTVKKVVTRGWPAFIFCSAKNESNWPAWPEIQSRFVITSPNMIAQKYLEGNMLTAQKMGLPRLVQQALIVSDNDAELAKKCVLYLIQQLKECTVKKNDDINSKANPVNSSIVWIPFGQILANILPAEKGTDNRITKRIFSFLTIITLSRSQLRCRLRYGQENLVISDLEDLHEVLHITQHLSGIPPYKLRIFKEIFLELYKSKEEPNKSKDGTKEEHIIAVTSRQICDYYKEKTRKTITSNNLKQNYLNEYINNGLIDDDDSVIDNRQKVYYPIVDVRDEDNNDKSQGQKIKTFSICDRMDNILQHPKLLVPKRFKYIPENWLELEIFQLMKCPSKLDKFELYDEKNQEVCICIFINNYQKNAG